MKVVSDILRLGRQRWVVFRSETQIGCAYLGQLIVNFAWIRTFVWKSKNA